MVTHRSHIDTLRRHRQLTPHTFRLDLHSPTPTRPPSMRCSTPWLMPSVGTIRPRRWHLARNLQPGSAIKPVMRARQLGYLGKATKGRSGGLTNGTAV